MSIKIKKDFRILVVDYEGAMRRRLAHVLDADGFEVTLAANGAEALQLHEQLPFALVFIDIALHDISGTQLLKALKAPDPDTQVVVMTRYASLDTALAVLRAGAYDYLTKPFEDIGHVTATARRAIEKVRLKRENSGLIEALKLKTEQLQEANRQLKHLATHDELTGLYNHRYFQERLGEEINLARRYQKRFALLFIDLDYFKIYNDTNGHQAGDSLLKELAVQFMAGLRKTDVVARYGGDEFGVILPETPLSKAQLIAEKLCTRVAHYPFKGCEGMPGKRVTISVGCGVFPQHGNSANALLKHADKELYGIKRERLINGLSSTIKFSAG